MKKIKGYRVYMKAENGLRLYECEDCKTYSLFPQESFLYKVKPTVLGDHEHLVRVVTRK